MSLGDQHRAQQDGYFYKVGVNAAASGQPLHISVYDPEFAYNG